MPALISGAMFNLSNLLLVVGIDAAGMCVAFPVGVGLALVIGTVESYLETPKGNPGLLFTGRGADRVRDDSCPPWRTSACPRSGGRESAARRDLLRHRRRADGLLLSAADARRSRRTSTPRPSLPGMLTPYVALVVLRSRACWRATLCGTRCSCAPARSRTATISAAARGCTLIGILGGCIWMLALSFNVIASAWRDRRSLRAGPGRHPGGGLWGSAHLARVPRGAGGNHQVSGADARRVHHRTGADWRGDAVKAG